MVSNAFTSNSYVASGQSSVAVLVRALVGWSGYIISGVGTATLAAALILRKVDKKFEKLENEYEDFEKMICESRENENMPNEIKELKNELKSIHDENAELKREIVELKDLIKNK